MRGLRSRLEPVTLARFVAAHWTEAGAYAAAVFACVTFASRAVDRHRSFESNAYDFGFFDQIVWNTSHGRWFASSFTPYNFLGQHFQPVLLIFALAYRLGAGIESLLSHKRSLSRPQRYRCSTPYEEQRRAASQGWR